MASRRFRCVQIFSSNTSSIGEKRVIEPRYYYTKTEAKTHDEPKAN